MFKSRDLLFLMIVAFALITCNFRDEENSVTAFKKEVERKKESKVTQKKYVNPFGKKINQKAYKIYKNQKGYWEAMFDYCGLVMVYIPAGEFTMGCNRFGCGPEHKVYLNGYWIGKYEVTFFQYDVFCSATGREAPSDFFKWGRGERPVFNVSWKDATAFCEWLSHNIGLKFKLPTEAQWEMASRGNDQRLYPWGNSPPTCRHGNYSGCFHKTQPVGSFPLGQSPYGLMEMSGNVWEWCQDWYSKSYYLESPDKNPGGPSNGFYRVYRGGSYLALEFGGGTFYRSYGIPERQVNDLGFRIAMSL